MICVYRDVKKSYLRKRKDFKQKVYMQHIQARNFRDFQPVRN